MKQGHFPSTFIQSSSKEKNKTKQGFRKAGQAQRVLQGLQPFGDSGQHGQAHCGLPPCPKKSNTARLGLDVAVKLFKVTDAWAPDAQAPALKTKKRSGRSMRFGD